MIRDHYQVGGSLKQNARSYVTRQADIDLYQALLKGELCYVFNARQMGKSSLRIRMQRQLKQEGMRCVAIDMTRLGSESMRLEQWYKSLAAELVSNFELWGQVNLKQWWQVQQDASPLQRLSLLLEEILAVHLPQEKLFIFIDEIDSLLSLPFPVDDFFAWIRYCYNQRAEQPIYQRLNWALFGVTTPSELICDRTRTPFNIGRAIELRGFDWQEAQPLLEGLQGVVSDPPQVLQEILHWTGGQPFLTQKLCRIVQNAAADAKIEMGTEMGTETETEPIPLSPGAEALWIEELVRSQLIDYWQTQDQPEHLRTIRDRLLRQEERAGRLLGLYQQIVESTGIALDTGLDQTELLLSGLVEKSQDRLRVKNRIYREVFNLAWVREHLGKLRPYGQGFEAWVASGQRDQSRLLRGQALVDAQEWSRGKRLSDLDYQFLAASQQCDRQEVQQSLEAARAQEVQARLQQQRQVAKLQQLLLATLSLALMIAIAISLVAIGQYQEAAASERAAKISEMRALASSSQGLFASNQQLDALIDAIKAKRHLEGLTQVDAPTTAAVEDALRQAVYGTNEFNRLIGHQGGVLGVTLSPDGKLIATSSNDKTLRIWQRDGTLLQTLPQSTTPFSVAFGANGRLLIVGNVDGTVQVLWLNQAGTKTTRVRSIQAHPAPIWRIAISPNDKLIASASADGTVKVWRLDGTLQAELRGHGRAVWGVAFSPDSQTLASAGADRTIRLWTTQGAALKTLTEHQAPLWSVAFCPQTNLLVSGSSDRTVKFWQLDGTLIRTLAVDRPVLTLTCSANGQFIATGGQDKVISLWSPDGTLINTLKQHQAVLRDVAMSADGLMTASASEDGTVKLWQRNKRLLRFLNGHEDTVWDVATSPDGEWIASVGDRTLNLWRSDGTLASSVQTDAALRSVSFSPQNSRLLVTGSDSGMVQLWQIEANQSKANQSKANQSITTLPAQLQEVWRGAGHKAAIFSLAISADGQTIASSADDRTIKLWSIEGKLLHSINAHEGRIWRIAFSSQGNRLASASTDGTVKLWSVQPGTKPDEPIATFPVQGVWGVAFSPDGQTIATTSRDNQLQLWRLDGSLIRAIPGQSRGLTRVAFSPDGQTIATVGVDNTVKLWSRSGQLLTTLPGHRGMVISLAFKADSNALVSGGDDTTVILWDLQQIRSLKPLQYACNWVKDYLRTNVEVSERDRQLCKGV